MSNIQEDYILRMIQMIGDLITAALHLKTMGKIVEADQTLDNVLHSLMPEHADLVEMVDENTALTLLGDSKLVEAYVDLLLTQAEIKIALEQPSDGIALQTKAVRLLIGSIQKERYVSPNGQTIWGWLSGLDLHLDKWDKEQWADLDQAIKKGFIIAP
ncbi:MAG: hypothetical protein HQ506_06800 [Candidatus Marinimicrobia bacterium]|nr:hypothetical protein [Candidatus Neomarinimicrobiota bacterium]